MKEIIILTDDYTSFKFICESFNIDNILLTLNLKDNSKMYFNIRNLKSWSIKDVK